MRTAQPYRCPPVTADSLAQPDDLGGSICQALDSQESIAYHRQDPIFLSNEDFIWGVVIMYIHGLLHARSRLQLPGGVKNSVGVHKVVTNALEDDQGHGNWPENTFFSM